MAASVSASSITRAKPGRSNSSRGLPLIIAVVAALAAIFIYRSVLHYVLDYSSGSFGDYWPHRGRLLIHLSGGTIALLTGIFQLWSGLRMRFPKVHRWTGRVYLVAVGIGTVGALWLATTPSFGWNYGTALTGLAFAWSGCALMGYRAIRARKVAMHRRWMIRAYVVTFAFVIYRIIELALFHAGVKDVPTVEITAAWACWTIPLAITLVVQRTLSHR